MISSRDIILALFGSIVSAIGALLLSIYADLLPGLLPALQGVTAETYVKIILLLFLVVALIAAVAVTLYVKAKPYKPRSLSGKAFGFKWSAELDYSKKREEIEIELQWLCPKHGVFLGIKSAEIPETAYYNLWCAKCGHIHEMKSGGAPVYVQEAERIVRRQILSRLRP